MASLKVVRRYCQNNRGLNLLLPNHASNDASPDANNQRSATHLNRETPLITSSDLKETILDFWLPFQGRVL
jgi:hypothetical protein